MNESVGDVAWMLPYMVLAFGAGTQLGWAATGRTPTGRTKADWEHGHYNGQMFAGYKWKKFLRRVDKEFPDSAIGDLYNKIVDEDPTMMRMITSNANRHKMAKNLSQNGMESHDIEVLQQVAIKLKHYHRAKKKEQQALKEKRRMRKQEYGTTGHSRKLGD